MAVSDLTRFAPQALALVGAHLEDRERAVVSAAVRALDSDEGLTAAAALETIVAVREVRRLRQKLEADVATVESTARRHAEALAR